MPRNGQALKHSTIVKDNTWISSIFAKRGVNFQSYREKSATVEQSLLKGLFFDLSKELFLIKSDQFIEGVGNDKSPDLTPLFNDYLIILISNDPEADLKEIYDRRGHQLLLVDGAKRSHVLVTNLVNWEIYSVSGCVLKYSL